MNRRHFRYFVVLLCFMLLLSACTYSGKEVYISDDLTDERLFTIGDETCSMKEARVYLLNTKNIYGQLQGQNLLGEGFDATFMADSIKDATIGHLTRVYCMLQVGSKEEMTLSDQDKALAAQCANEYIRGLSVQESSYLDVTENELGHMYENYILAKRVYENAMSEVNTNVTEDECRIMDATVLYTTSDADAAAALSELNGGEAYDAVCDKYSQLRQTHISFGKGEYAPLIESQVFALDNGAWCGPISAGGGYYFFRCDNKFNPEKSEENKMVIITERRKDIFENMLKKVEEDNYSKFNSEYWNNLSLDELNGLNSDSFFEILNSKMNN